MKRYLVKIKSIFHSQSGAVYQLRDVATNHVLWQVTEQNRYGMNTKVNLGNQLKQERKYDSFGFPEYVKAIENKTNGKNVFELTTNFDQQRGNLRNRHYKSFTTAEAFEYDQLDRLKTATGQFPTNQTYDARGRINTNGQVGTYRYQPGTTYQLQKAELNTAGTQYYNNHTEQQITYNALKKPLQIYEEGHGRVDFDYTPGM